MVHEQTPELIEQEMAQTREALTEKVAALESQVKDTLNSATAAVQDTVAGVKSAVSDTKASVAEMFDLGAHTRKHPWALVGGAAMAGLLTGMFAGRRSVAAEPMAAPLTGYRPVTAVPTEPRQPDMLDDLMARASQELRSVAQEAIAAVSASLRDQVQGGIPKLVNLAAQKLA